MEELPTQHIQRSSKAHLNKWEDIGAILMRNALHALGGGWQALAINHTYEEFYGFLCFLGC